MGKERRNDREKSTERQQDRGEEKEMKSGFCYSRE